MAAPGREGTEINVTVEVGSCVTIGHTVVDRLGAEVDLTGAQLEALVKADDADADTACKATFTIEDPTDANVVMTLDETDTTVLVGGTTYSWDLLVELPADHPTHPSYRDYPCYGTLKMTQPTTRDFVLVE